MHQVSKDLSTAIEDEYARFAWPQHYFELCRNVQAGVRFERITRKRRHMVSEALQEKVRSHLFGITSVIEMQEDLG